jgi:3-hydroxy-3-methylglutaryl CoA synthase
MPEAAGTLATLVAPQDTEALARAMYHMLYDDMLRARTQVEGPQWARRFSLEQMAHQYVDVYTQVSRKAQRSL